MKGRKNMSKVVEFLNEKGAPKASVRNAMRDQVVNYLVTHTDFVSGPNGLYMAIAETPEGELIYANLNLSISMTDPTVKKVRKSTSGGHQAEQPVVANLFD